MRLAPWLISDLVIVAIVVGLAVVFLPAAHRESERLQAMQQQLELAKKRVLEADQAKQKAEESQVALQKAREAEERARKENDLAKVKELAEARQRAEGEARSRADVTSTIRGCASLLPKGRSYKVSLNATIDTTGAQPHLTGGLDISDGTTKDRQEEGAAFTRCVGRLVR